MNITIDKLKKDSEYIFAYLAENYGKLSIEIEDDFCWDIPKEEMFDISNEPKNCTLASIYDAIHHIESLDNKSESNVPTAYSLRMLSLLIRYMSEKTAF